MLKDYNRDKFLTRAIINKHSISNVKQEKKKQITNINRTNTTNTTINKLKLDFNEAKNCHINEGSRQIGDKSEKSSFTTREYFEPKDKVMFKENMHDIAESPQFYKKTNNKFILEPVFRKSSQGISMQATQINKILKDNISKHNKLKYSLFNSNNKVVKASVKATKSIVQECSIKASPIKNSLQKLKNKNNFISNKLSINVGKSSEIKNLSNIKSKYAINFNKQQTSNTTSNFSSTTCTVSKESGKSLASFNNINNIKRNSLKSIGLDDNLQTSQSNYVKPFNFERFASESKISKVEPSKERLSKGNSPNSNNKKIENNKLSLSEKNYKFYNTDFDSKFENVDGNFHELFDNANELIKKIDLTCVSIYKLSINLK